MRIRLLAQLAFIAALLSGSARADTVYLLNGGVLEGRVFYEDGRIVVEQRSGKVYLTDSKIDHIEKNRTDLDEYADRLAALMLKEKDASADDWVALAQYASDHGMTQRAEQNFRQALTVDTNNAAARLALGYVKQDGRWLTSDDANAARGLVKYQGLWMTPQALVELLKAEAQAAAAQANLEAERLKLERADTELKAIEAAREEQHDLGPRDRQLEFVGGVATAFPVVLPMGPGTPGVPSAPVSVASKSAPPSSHSFAPVQVSTPTQTVMHGPGGSLIVRQK